MRAFIGFDFDEKIKDQILEIQQELKKHAIKGRWKYRDNFHLTLKFLDEINGEQLNKIESCMRELSHGQVPFSINLERLGAFDGRDCIRVLWMGITGEVQALRSLQSEVENALVPVGFSAEKRSYKPHITIAQDVIFQYSLDDVVKKLEPVKLGPCHVKSIFLFKSEQVQNKRVYTPLQEFSMYRHE